MKDTNKKMFHVDKPNNNNDNKSNLENNNINKSSKNILNNNNSNYNNNLNNNNNIINYNTNLNLELKKSKSSLNQNQKYLFPNQNILFFDKGSNVFNSIRDNQTSFYHLFIDDKTSHFINYLEEPIYFSYKINLTTLIENRKGFEEFIEEYNWEYYELILYIASCKMNSEIFDKYNEYIMIYLYDGMKKLNEINFSQEIQNNKNKKYCLNKLNWEKDYFYKIKKADFEENSEESYKLKCIVDDNNFFCECFIYYKFNQCKSIDLTNYKFNNITIQPLLNILKFKENLFELNLSNNEIGNEGCYCLGNLLRINRNLSVLNLTGCKIGDLGLTFFLKGIDNKYKDEKCNLTKLILSENKLTENSGKNLGNLLLSLTKLQWLNISNNKINNKGAQDFFDIYKEILEDELAINLSLNNNNNCTSENMTNLSLNNYNSKMVNNLEYLILIDIGIFSESCLRILGDIIKLPKCGLKSLILSRNSIGITKSSDKDLNDILYFLDCLKQNKTITELMMLSCSIENTIAQKIYDTLKVNKTIENLVLYDNKINEQKIFLKLLSLFSVSDENKNNGNNGIINNIMKDLDLSKNNCRININDNFLNIIEELQLSSLDISQNELSKEGIESFKNLANRIGDRLKIIY